MRHAYPLLFCLTENIQAKFYGKITSLDVIPDEVWQEWQERPMVERRKPPPPAVMDIDDWGRFIRRAPSRSRSE